MGTQKNRLKLMGMLKIFTTYTWVKCIQNILQSVGRNKLWLAKQVMHPKPFKKNVKELLENQELKNVHVRLG